MRMAPHCVRTFHPTRRSTPDIQPETGKCLAGYVDAAEPEKKGSSQIFLHRSPEGILDLQDEVVVVSESVRLSLDDLDLVVDAFEAAPSTGASVITLCKCVSDVGVTC
jgi:hypothetical protein